MGVEIMCYPFRQLFSSDFPLSCVVTATLAVASCIYTPRILSLQSVSGVGTLEAFILFLLLAGYTESKFGILQQPR